MHQQVSRSLYSYYKKRVELCNLTWKDIERWQWFHQSLDVNECYLGLHRCHPNATCTNTIGSHKCSCKVGYIGDGVYKCMPEHDVGLQEVEKKMTTLTPYLYNQNSQQGLVNTLGGKSWMIYLWLS